MCAHLTRGKLSENDIVWLVKISSDRDCVWLPPSYNIVHICFSFNLDQIYKGNIHDESDIIDLVFKKLMIFSINYVQVYKIWLQKKI